MQKTHFSRENLAIDLKKTTVFYLELKNFQKPSHIKIDIVSKHHKRVFSETKNIFPRGHVGCARGWDSRKMRTLHSRQAWGGSRESLMEDPLW